MERVIILKRICKNDDGVFGVLLDTQDNQVFGLTIELPDRSNQKFISCIPKGYYICTRYISATYGKTFLINDVPNREHIMFHIANTKNDLQGCIGVGQQFGRLNGLDAVLYSWMGFNAFMKKTDAVNEFLLKIKEC